jgi:16S rRNA processing protein RimM
MEKFHFLPIGKIVGIHGIKGTIKVYSYAESFSVFESEKIILSKNLEREKETYTIQWAKPHKRNVLVYLKEITSRESAETLVGAEVFIEKKNLPELEKGTYYWIDLIGISVYTIQEEYIGRIESIIPTGSNDVYVVKDPLRDESNEILIPALESVVVEVDLERKIMRVDLPEGL